MCKLGTFHLGFFFFPEWAFRSDNTYTIEHFHDSASILLHKYPIWPDKHATEVFFAYVTRTFQIISNRSPLLYPFFHINLSVSSKAISYVNIQSDAYDDN